ncbi:long chain acyl-CoA synthetase 1-like [Phoenix dactylifera]|uniref:Long chain acyl-CoA synthetase 1-like n=1 Tax=Phoenix dactylifera TaxID=42345 RepID=A0A8B9AME2_PHODC|nr:long chain acyl-CoA synthetase 1-like [Phoenix dactylifera]
MPLSLFMATGSGAINYIIEHAEVDVVFVQDKNMKEILSADCKSAQRLKSIVTFASTTREQIDAATNSGVKVHSWNEFLQMVSLLRFCLHILTISSNQEIILVALLTTKTERKLL